MCFVWIWEQTATISLYSIDWPEFITEAECVYCAVRPGYLNIIQVNPSIFRSRWLLSYWNCGFESHRRHRCVSVVCCQVVVSASCRSLARGVLSSAICECDCAHPIMRRPWFTGTCHAMNKELSTWGAKHYVMKTNRISELQDRVERVDRYLHACQTYQCSNEL